MNMPECERWWGVQLGVWASVPRCACASGVCESARSSGRASEESQRQVRKGPRSPCRGRVREGGLSWGREREERLRVSARRAPAPSHPALQAGFGGEPGWAAARAKGAGGPDKGPVGCAFGSGSGERGPRSGGGPGAGPGAAGRGGPGWGLAPGGVAGGRGGGAGERREGWGRRERAAPSRGLRRLASGRLRAAAERENERSRPGHGTAGGGRAAAGAAAARAAARGECAGRGSLRAPLAALANLAGTLVWDCGARQGPWAGTGRRHPLRWGCPEGRPGNSAWGRGAGRPVGEPMGRPATLPSLPVALGMAWPAIPGDQAEKLRAGRELGGARAPLSVPTWKGGTH